MRRTSGRRRAGGGQRRRNQRDGAGRPRHDGPRYSAGAPGSGDEYFPFAGNGGYDVLHYDLALRYAPPANPAVLAGRLSGVATITLRAKQNLQSLNFDLRGLGVTSVRVDGKAGAEVVPECRTTRTASGNSPSGCGQS